MRGFPIGRVFGIPIRLHWSFLIILPVFAAIIGWDIVFLAELLNQILVADIDPEALEGVWRPWILGLAAAVGLFLGVLFHEFGHSLVAMRYGYEIESITLWLLGGLANFAEMPENWRHEFFVAVAGPLVSIAVGVACYFGFLLTPPEVDTVRFVLGYLAVLNIFLAVFNMLPAFPMDGGRVLRALLARTRPHAQATQEAAAIGKMFAFFMGIIGLLWLNIILILLAFFIYIAAAGEAQHTVLKAAFEGVTVADVMTTRDGLHVAEPEMTVRELVEQMFEERHTGYPVVANGDVLGMVTLGDIQDIQAAERDAYRVGEVMSSDVITIPPNADAMEAFRKLQEHDIGRLAVVNSDGDIVGIVSRTDLMTAFDILQTRETLPVRSERSSDSTW